MCILISWLHQEPADLDVQCFQKRINTGSAGQGLIAGLKAEKIFCHQNQADLDVQCFSKQDKSRCSRTRVN